MAGLGWDNQPVTSFLNQSQVFEQILSALPHTQCTRCGYADCAAYAQAIASSGAAINQCPPGGVEGIRHLSTITGLPFEPLNPVNGIEGPRSVAFIDEEWCIGCTLCIKTCPVDAIFGSNRQMHTVIESNCTGCELCLPVCPVDCIGLENVTGTQTGWNAWSAEDAQESRRRYAFHSYKSSLRVRKAGETIEKNDDLKPSSLPQTAEQHSDQSTKDAAAARKRTAIDAALDRSRRQRQVRP